MKGETLLGMLKFHGKMELVRRSVKKVIAGVLNNVDQLSLFSRYGGRFVQFTPLEVMRFKLNI